ARNPQRRCECCRQARAQPAEALRVLPASVLIPLLGATLPGDAQLACYHWRELPRQLLLSEMGPASADSQAVLRKVLRHGSYGTFERYMETYVGLLRENTFSKMRAGLSDLRRGRLDSSDMQVWHGVRVVGMAPCDTGRHPPQAGGRGTILELHVTPDRPASGQDRPDGEGTLPMFGSLVALAPGSEFSAGVAWATVAAADTVSMRGGGGRGREVLRVCVELSSDLNEGKGDALLTHSGQLTLVKSPTFYRACGPALEVLQSLEEGEMPLREEILLGEEGPPIDLEGWTVDSSVVFQPRPEAVPEEATGDTDEEAEDAAKDREEAMAEAASPARASPPRVRKGRRDESAMAKERSSPWIQPPPSEALSEEERESYAPTSPSYVPQPPDDPMEEEEEEEESQEEDMGDAAPPEADATMAAPALCEALLTLSLSRPSADGTLSWDPGGGSGQGGGAVMGSRAARAQELTRSNQKWTTLDPSQCAALHAILTRRISVIQGPPGTGKSYTGVRAVQLLASLAPPVDQPAMGPVLTLDDLLLECLRIFPHGVVNPEPYFLNSTP
ncbi:hypothetical protein T484DRAFT_1832739, partial [Baffinella frigidus]